MYRLRSLAKSRKEVRAESEDPTKSSRARLAKLSFLSPPVGYGKPEGDKERGFVPGKDPLDVTYVEQRRTEGGA